METLGQRAAAILFAPETLAKVKARGSKLTKQEVADIIDGCGAKIVTPPAKSGEPRLVIPRKRNELLDALVEATGSKPEELTGPAMRAAAVALAEIKQVCPNLDREEIFRRVAEYKRKHRDWPVTPPAVAKHWASLGGGPRTMSAKMDIYCEPPNWIAAASKVLGVQFSAFEGKAWLDLGPDTRAQVIRHLNT